MPTCQRATVVDADFETVWAFYDDVDELRALTPAWMGLEIPRVVGPDGEEEPDGYAVGTEIHLRSPALDLAGGPWIVEIVEREVAGDRAHFIDEQVGDNGPFEHWRHEHRFADLGGETLVHDRITYRLPAVSELLLATPGLAAMLWYRHRRTRQLLDRA